MDATKESVMRMGKQEEQKVSPAAAIPAAAAAAVTVYPAGTKEQDKAASVTTPSAATNAHHAPPPPPPSPASALVASGGRVAEKEMENAGGGSSGGGVAAAAAAVAGQRSPLAAAVSELSDHVLEGMMKVLGKKCMPPQDVYPLLGKSPTHPPWWPTENEAWWPQLGADAVAPVHKPTRLLSKAEKEAAVVAMVKIIAPDFETVFKALRKARSVSGAMTDTEASAWHAGVSAECDAYVPPPRQVSLWPEASRARKRKAPAPKTRTPVAQAYAEIRPTIVLALVAPGVTSAVDIAPAPARVVNLSAVVEIEDMNDKSKTPALALAIENPVVWRVYNRIAGKENSEKGNGSCVAGESAICHNAGAEMTGNPEAGESSMNPGTVMQPNAEMSINLETGGSSSKPCILLQPNAGLKTEDQVEAETNSKTESGSEYEEAKASEIISNQDSRAMLQSNKAETAKSRYLLVFNNFGR
uniref:Ethylene insensitive 3-like DNA-binding domain-containing protein n=1 Tax=Leersia perrieri TaxID=77586 RepID=A0A0D9WXN3_9ORYZ